MLSIPTRAHRHSGTSRRLIAWQSCVVVMDDSDISDLTNREIITIIRSRTSLPAHCTRNRHELLKYIGSNLDHDTIAALRAQASDNRHTKQIAKEARVAKRRRKTHNVRAEEGERIRAEQAGDVQDTSRYLELPTQDDINQCHQAFYEFTGNTATAAAVCAVCARETPICSSGFQYFTSADIVNRHRLIPKKSHPAHYLLDGMLLEPAGVVEESAGERWIRICRDCQAALRKDHDRPPQYSLANGLWVGRTPWELEVLTLPEHMLIALVYPRVFVYKLFPTSLHRKFDDAHYQRGLRGSVTTYALDQTAIVDMLRGNLMPRRPQILASVISLLYIGKGKLPLRMLRNLFRVRRHVVLQALHWLQINNTKYYGQIQLDHDALRSLPEDDVPDAIINIIRHSHDVDAVERERAGHTQHDDGGEKAIIFSKLYSQFSIRIQNLMTQTTTRCQRVMLRIHNKVIRIDGSRSVGA